MNRISRIAIRRFVDEERARNPAYEKELKVRIPSLASLRTQSDDELLQQLKTCGVDDVDREWLDQATSRYWAAYQVADGMAPTEENSDLVWLCLMCLWERWFPDRPSFELIDEWMQQGYGTTEPAAQCELWKQTWGGVLNIMKRGSYRTITEFDNAWGASQSVFNWVQDYETELLNHSRADSNCIRHRLELTGAVIDGLSTNQLLTENFRRSHAEALFTLGDADQATALYKQWLADDPDWGWGWIGWSDNYFVLSPDAVEDNPDYAVELLQRALDVPSLRDRSVVLDRMAIVLEDTGRDEEARTIRSKIDKVEAAERNAGMFSAPMATPAGMNREPIGLPPRSDDFASGKKIGRNEPCPCGSGRKFKKCCNRNP